MQHAAWEGERTASNTASILDFRAFQAIGICGTAADEKDLLPSPSFHHDAAI
jgi:hypothetical protein